MSAPLEILLVEDNPADVFIVREALKRSGFAFNLHVAPDGEGAVSLLDSIESDQEQRCPALVLLDLNIPKMSGIEVLSRIRGGSRCSRVPVVIVTSSDSPDDVAAIQELNVSAYFRKPTSLTAYLELGTVVRSILEGEQPGS